MAKLYDILNLKMIEREKNLISFHKVYFIQGKIKLPKRKEERNEENINKVN